MNGQLKIGQRLMALAAPLLVMLVAVSGCGIRHQTAEDGSTETSFHFGLVAENKCAADKTTLIRGYNLGLWKDSSGGGIGFQRVRYACVSDRCQAIFWVDEEIDAEELKAQLGNPSNLCVLKQ